MAFLNKSHGYTISDNRDHQCYKNEFFHLILTVVFGIKIKRKICLDDMQSHLFIISYIKFIPSKNKTIIANLHQFL